MFLLWSAFDHLIMLKGAIENLEIIIIIIIIVIIITIIIITIIIIIIIIINYCATVNILVFFRSVLCPRWSILIWKETSNAVRLICFPNIHEASHVSHCRWSMH